MTRVLAALVALLMSSGCNRIGANMDFERMIDQAKFEAYELGPDAPEGRVMRHPPAGTVPRERPVQAPVTSARGPDGEYRESIPLRLDRVVLERGRDRFERFCGACHGVLGDGNQAVVENMALRPPPSLHMPEIVAQPPGRIFHTITHGYGLMPSYRNELEPGDRWAVVAYLQALWLSQRAQLAALPTELQREARRHLP